MVGWMGVWEALVVCFLVCAAWLWVFDWHFKARMPHNQQRREDERKKREGSPVCSVYMCMCVCVLVCVVVVLMAVVLTYK